ncbi:vWA domain-containing protein [Photobacterium angustum]|uniref:vWA domain-containing protein n=1 Tax=Photobacterium angustum TaxID=661 RepID=UPI00069AE202|nr:vWA domain-containing protein [Photobacterium angustum]PSV69642.1 VWA domain-containing protein [Photobacterium angustum]PSW96796.1 VWA domain-containing protein [Photobacterium angustum]PSX03799.1 VWA domain-containing protein [Photobacterium angustum]PSX36030.1 VWA domain-containing protein [Photobacterium angustum]
MKNILLPLTLISLSLLAGCGQAESSKSAAQEETDQIIVSGLTSKQSYALRGADQSWPGTADEKTILLKDKNIANYYVIFDGSGSMLDTSCGDGKRRITVAKDAIGTFFDALPKNSNVGLFVFDNNGYREVSPLQKNHASQLKAITNNVVAGGDTPLGKTLEIASNSLRTQGQKQQGYGEYNIVVLTDGQANNESKMMSVVNKITSETPINIHTIGFCLGNNHMLNQQGVINYQPASNAAELVKSLKSVLAESSSFTSDSFSAMTSKK